MNNQFKNYRMIILLICACLVLSACVSTVSTEEVRGAFQPVTSLTLPEEVTLVGIGEATHGNAEFVTLRKEVLAHLVEHYGFRAFAIEGDFGGGQVVNEYVLNGSGSAEEAVREIGFAIYRTQEMVDLVEWIRAYNQSAGPGERIHFYGYDMQRYDNNIAGLLAYFEQVDPTLVEPYRAALADLNDATVFDQEPEKIQAGLQAIEEIRAGMQREKERYIAASSPEAFELADQYAASIQQNATLRSGSSSYSELRDQFMAEKVRWIVEFEKSQGRGKVLIAGHNGHIEKSAAAPQYRSMGSRLGEQFGEAYFAIGTEFLESTFNAASAAGGGRQQFSVRNNSDLNKAFAASGMEIAYLDIASALDNPALAPLLTSNQPMSNIGDSFASWYTFLPVFYTLQMTPSEAYDGLIFVRSATPTTMLEE